MLTFPCLKTERKKFWSLSCGGKRRPQWEQMQRSFCFFSRQSWSRKAWNSFGCKGGGDYMWEDPSALTNRLQSPVPLWMLSFWSQIWCSMQWDSFGLVEVVPAWSRAWALFLDSEFTLQTLLPSREQVTALCGCPHHSATLQVKWELTDIQVLPQPNF